MSVIPNSQYPSVAGQTNSTSSLHTNNVGAGGAAGQAMANSFVTESQVLDKKRQVGLFYVLSLNELYLD